MLLFVRRSLLALIVSAFVMTMMTSCYSTKNYTYLQGTFDTAKLSRVNPIEPIIRKGDILSIIVYSDNPEATRIFNQSLITTAGNASSSAGAAQGIGLSPSSSGYEVDENGNIVFQNLGLLHVEGLTKVGLKDTLDNRLKVYLQNPYYNIRIVNYKFTMLGEVNRPGPINIPGERINLLEAIALAGDMTFFGRRDSILIIRESNNKREFARLDIRKPEIMASPYFYVQQNDVIIVEATKKKIQSNDQVFYRNITIAATLLSMFAIIYSIFK